jgi:hypothetical protein
MQQETESLKSSLDRFDLEQAIMSAWTTSEDIKLIWEQYYDGMDKLSEDQVANLLLGLQEIHNLRCQKLWDIYEKMVREKKI